MTWRPTPDEQQRYNEALNRYCDVSREELQLARLIMTPGKYAAAKALAEEVIERNRRERDN